MNKVKNGIANIPIYVGLGLKYLSEKSFEFSFKLHITFKTEVGAKIVVARENLLKMADAMRKAQEMQRAEESKLSNVLKLEPPSDQQPIAGVIQLGKKRTENKD